VYFLQKNTLIVLLVLAREPTWVLANKVPWTPIHTHGVLHKHVCIQLACLLAPEVYDIRCQAWGAINGPT